MADEPNARRHRHRHRRHGGPRSRAPRNVERVLAQPARRRRVDPRACTDEELLAAGVDPRRARAIPRYVPAGAAARRTSSCSTPASSASARARPRSWIRSTGSSSSARWEALEDAGYAPERFAGAIGVFAGAGHERLPAATTCSPTPSWSARSASSCCATPATTRTSSPRASRTSSTCAGRASTCRRRARPRWSRSTWPCQSLLSGECDMALAGGVTIELPHRPRLPLPRRARSSRPTATAAPSTPRAQGTVFGSGVGVVVLRRLADALADGDHDPRGDPRLGRQQRRRRQGRLPRAERRRPGRARSPRRSRSPASIADTIGYVEAHGTGTAGRRSDRGRGADRRPSAQAHRQAAASARIGSVKTNIGHLDTAAGVAGLIKAVAGAASTAQLPPSLHFEAPNPADRLRQRARSA